MDIFSGILQLILGIMFCVVSAAIGSWLFVPLGICFLLRGLLSFCANTGKRKK